MRKPLVLVLSFLHVFVANSMSQTSTENVVIVTLDGMRWQEVFQGADSSLINDSSYVSEPNEVKARFWASTPEERRQKLFPFLWSEIAQRGQLYGNRKKGSNVNNANPYWFSYPGYNEIFTGYPDTLVNSNDKIQNKNENVLAFLNKQNAFRGRIAAFTSWDCFDAILNENKSGIYVSSGFDTLSSQLLKDRELKLLNDMQFMAPRYFGDGVRPDFLTYQMAKRYLEVNKPKVMYLAFDETDDFAHGGKYDYYLNAASLIDKWIADLWNTLQRTPQYMNKTTLLITTDHGRGDAVKKTWRDHGTKVPDAGQIWLAAIGPDSYAAGEISANEELQQAQVAATIARLLGFSFSSDHPVAPPIQTVYSKK